MILLLIILSLISFLTSSLSGHEVVYGTRLRPGDIEPNELCIVQYDNRPMSEGTYWSTAMVWNFNYALKHGHQFILFSMRSQNCTYASYTLAPAWCKVKAMTLADTYTSSNTRAILYIDSDAVVTANYSMTDILSFMRKDLKWNYSEQPFAFNQDGPGWGCKFTTTKTPYKYCLNSGTVLWIKSPISTSILQSWWHSAGDPYDKTKFPTKWRTKWPWEQAQMYKIYEKYSRLIMKLSFPHEPFLPWTSKKDPKSQYPTDFVEPWCFSHWPGANCFITHHCASLNQKNRMNSMYDLASNTTTIMEQIVPYIFYIDNVDI